MAAPAALPEHVFVVPAAPSLPIIPTSAAVYPASAALLQQQRVAAALAAQANGNEGKLGQFTRELRAKDRH
ncbi:DgyrCDS2264 [Dimorphilus gyrociliatus]|uniref:DgyrCDS2264 n=1 Tax=Dimorphilus gyrociliatus TaxID=2664684 RepID=A0A7I8V9R2_9ANNE|nr:DgyrCDS2264 [Dimorphilus gyrociliatus]